VLSRHPMYNRVSQSKISLRKIYMSYLEIIAYRIVLLLTVAGK
jgi:hypothetical protein